MNISLSLKQQALNIILNKFPWPNGIYTNPWEYEYNRIVSVRPFVRNIVLESLGKFSHDILKEIIADHEGNRLIGMDFITYYRIELDSHKL